MELRLRELRKKAGYGSAKAFAEAIGMSENTYRSYENGTRNLYMDVAMELCDALGCSPDDLIGRTDAHAYKYTLTSEEKKLVDVYRSSSPVAQVAILSTVEAIAASIGEGVGTYTYEKVVRA